MRSFKLGDWEFFRGVEAGYWIAKSDGSFPMPPATPVDLTDPLRDLIDRILYLEDKVEALTYEVAELELGDGL